MLLDWDTEHPARSLAVEVFALTEGLEGDFFAGEPREERGKAALTELFETVRSGSTPIIVEKVVEEIDNVVRQVRFDGWQSTSEGGPRGSPPTALDTGCQVQDQVHRRFRQGSRIHP